MMWANALNYLNITLIILLSIYGLHALIITTLYLLHFRKKSPVTTPQKQWPVVAVQIPLYNEKDIAVRMIDTACAFDYPRDRLTIQVLDDSTDQTTEMVRLRIQHYRSLGYNIEMLHRDSRVGYKAGALAQGLKRLDVEFVAIFDADFLPRADYLKRVIPHFNDHPEIGVVQCRWGHLNRDTNLLTRTQALFLDGHQVVEQVARSRSGLMGNFNGTAGIWRMACITDSGGWEWDTLAEDIDLSYRAQMKGWKILFLPNLIVGGEVPTTLAAFKKQQYRWTFGHIQAFGKLITKIWSSPELTLAQRIGGSFHLSTNFGQIAALITFLLSVPLAILHPKQPSSLGLISMASSGPTVLFAISQIFGYRDGFKRTLGRILYMPVLVLLAVGLSISNCGAVIGALAGHKMEWSVTPKSNHGFKGFQRHSIPVTVWLEIALSIYCAVALSLALQGAHEIIPMASLGMLSFGFVGCTGLVESSRPKKASSVKVEMVQQ